MKMFRFILGISGMISSPTIIILAWSNPMLENYNLFYVVSFIYIFILSLFMAESLMDRVVS